MQTSSLLDLIARPPGGGSLTTQPYASNHASVLCLKLVTRVSTIILTHRRPRHGRALLERRDPTV